MAREYLLAKTQDVASIDVLGIEHLAQVLALQDETRSALPEGQKMFVLPQSADYFASLLSRKNGLMVGIRVNGQLVAQMALMGPLTVEDAVTRNAITRNDVHFHHTDPSDLAVICKSMAVHPKWRGHELSQHMLEAVLDLPVTRTADHVFAQISVDNLRSWELFLRHGFGIVAAAIDVTDQKPRFVLQKPALGLALHEVASISRLDPIADFVTIMRATGQEALIGQLQDGGLNFALSMHAAQTTAGAWPDSEEAKAS